jgi:hypothetical protein
LAEVYRKKDWLFQVFGLHGEDVTRFLGDLWIDKIKEKFIFIRPDDNAKSFHGELVAKESFDEWFRIANVFNPGPKCMTLVSEPSKIESEYRFVISERKVLTGSQYKLNGKLEYSPHFPVEAANLAEEIANSCEFNPHPMFIMDICKIEDWQDNEYRRIHGDQRYKLMEIGSVNCAGMYTCDLRKFVEKASELAGAEWQDIQ